MVRLGTLTSLVLLVPSLALASGGHAEGTLSEQLFGSPEFWGAVVNFGLLVFILYKLARKPLGEHLAERRLAVERGIAEAAEMKRAAQEKFNEYSKRLEQLDDELAKLRKDIEAAAESEKEKILAEAQETAARLKNETETMIERHAHELAREVRRDVVEAAVAAAEEVLRDGITGPDQQRLASDFAKRIAESKGKA